MKEIIKEKIYRNSPVFIQNIIVSIKGYQIRKTRLSEKFRQMLAEFEKSDPDKVNEKELRSFLMNAGKSVFWKERFDTYGVDPQSKDLISEIKKLPVLTKEEVQDHIEKIRIDDLDDKIRKITTSGTTGRGLSFQQTRTMENKQWAVWWRYRKRHGIGLHTWMGWFGSKNVVDVTNRKPPFWRIDYVRKQVMFSQFHLNTDTVGSYYNEIRKRKIKWLHGFPSVLANFAALIREKGLDPLPMDYVSIGAENLLEYQADSIKKIFGVEPIQHYGLAEGVANISELPGKEMQIDQDFAYVELLPSGFAPDIFRIIGTNYSNQSFPLIRYDTKDLARVSFNGEGNYKILSIDGRKEDYITLPGGYKIGRLSSVFKTVSQVKEAQIYQPDINHVILRIVQGTAYDKDRDEPLLLKRCRERFGEEINIRFEYVTAIKRTDTGKLRYVISDVK